MSALSFGAAPSGLRGSNGWPYQVQSTSWYSHPISPAKSTKYFMESVPMLELAGKIRRVAGGPPAVPRGDPRPDPRGVLELRGFVQIRDQVGFDQAARLFRRSSGCARGKARRAADHRDIGLVGTRREQRHHRVRRSGYAGEIHARPIRQVGFRDRHPCRSRLHQQRAPDDVSRPDLVERRSCRTRFPGGRRSSRSSPPKPSCCR